MRKLIEILRTLYRKLGKHTDTIDVNKRLREVINRDRCESSE